MYSDTCQKITFEFYSAQKQSTCQYEFPPEILNFNIQFLNNNHNQPYPIPAQILSSNYPFNVMKQFMEAHQYKTNAFRLIKPINSGNYIDLVDPQTYSVCSKFTLLQNSQKATQVVNLCRFIRFHQLHDAICAAIATNYYIPPNNEQALNEFKKKHKIDDLSPDEISDIIKQYEQVFNIIEAKAKEEFMKSYEQPSEQDSNNM